mmetsp:Transcript_4559/g.5120  ORF Transcript_4559/g.5120 Transcript_4559/m.5120 type:complete len:140 (+) Transcript_4559:342-761(+)
MSSHFLTFIYFFLMLFYKHVMYVSYCAQSPTKYLIMPTENTSLKHTTPAGDSNTSTTFLQSVLSNKIFVVLVVVVLGTGLMAYNANPVPASSQFRLGNYAAIVDGGEGGGITASKNGGDLAGGGGAYGCFPYCMKGKHC